PLSEHRGPNGDSSAFVKAGLHLIKPLHLWPEPYFFSFEVAVALIEKHDFSRSGVQYCLFRNAQPCFAWNLDLRVYVHFRFELVDGNRMLKTHLHPTRLFIKIGRNVRDASLCRLAR